MYHDRVFTIRSDLPPQISPDRNFNFSSQEFWEAHRNFAKAEV